MTYASQETSVDSGRPNELYEVRYTGHAWYYTSGDTAIVKDTKTYLPVACSRSSFEETTDAVKASITVKFPITSPIGEVFRIQPPSEVVTLTIYAEHLGDPDLGMAVIWKGRVINVEWEGPWLTLTSESVFSSLLRPGLGPRYSRQCIVPLYSNQCGVLRAAFKVTAECGAVSGLNVYVNDLIGLPENRFAGGYLTWINADNGSVEKRSIRTSVSATGMLVLSSMPLGLTPGQILSIFPGCDHTLATCHSKYNNSANYQGTPYIPTKNPFGGTTLF